MPTTALGLVYPASTDNVQVWTHIQTLATGVDTLITADRARLTTLEGRHVGTKYATGGTLCTSAAAETAMTAWTGGDATVPFTNGYIYRLDLSVGAHDSGTAGTGGTVIARVRRTVNDTASAILGHWQAATDGGGAVKWHSLWSYVKNASGADISASLGLTVTKSVGGSSSLYGDTSGLPAILTVTRIGPTASFAALAAIAWAIT
jgi:hypothetical protein